MFPTPTPEGPEHGIKHTALAPELESKTILVDNTWQAAVREGSPVLCKTARSLDEDALDEDEDSSRMAPHISSKCQRMEDGTAQVVHHKWERKKVLAQYGASYRLNHCGSGVFTLNMQRRQNSGEISEVRTFSASSLANRGYLLFPMNYAGRSVLYEFPNKSTTRNTAGIPATGV